MSRARSIDYDEARRLMVIHENYSKVAEILGTSWATVRRACLSNKARKKYIEQASERAQRDPVARKAACKRYRENKWRKIVQELLENLKEGDKIRIGIFGRSIKAKVDSVDLELKMLYTDFGPVPFSNISTLERA